MLLFVRMMVYAGYILTFWGPPLSVWLMAKVAHHFQTGFKELFGSVCITACQNTDILAHARGLSQTLERCISLF